MQILNIGAGHTSQFECEYVHHCTTASISTWWLQSYTFSSILITCLCCCRLLFTIRCRAVFFPSLCCLYFQTSRPAASHFEFQSNGRCQASNVYYLWAVSSAHLCHISWTEPLTFAGCILIFLIFLWKACYFGEQPNTVEAVPKRRSTNGFLNVDIYIIFKKYKTKQPNNNKQPTKTQQNPQKRVTGELIRPNPPTAIWSNKLSILFI